jgi:hypothetical protein
MLISAEQNHMGVWSSRALSSFQETYYERHPLDDDSLPNGFRELNAE